MVRHKNLTPAQLASNRLAFQTGVEEKNLTAKKRQKLFLLLRSLLSWLLCSLLSGLLRSLFLSSHNDLLVDD